MRKYIVRLIIIVGCVSLLEWFGIIDIPGVDLSDLTVAKQEVEAKTDVIYYKIN